VQETLVPSVELMKSREWCAECAGKVGRIVQPDEYVGRGRRVGEVRGDRKAKARCRASLWVGRELTKQMLRGLVTSAHDIAQRPAVPGLYTLQPTEYRFDEKNQEKNIRKAAAQATASGFPYCEPEP
jgi:hypothetical protein